MINNSGGAAPYTYNWSTGQSGIGLNSLTNLSAGSYSVQVTDNNNCKNILTLIIPQPSPITTSFTPIPIKCNGDTTSLSVNNSGSHSPYTYLWNTTSTSNQIHGIAAGIYTVTITDSTGCTKTFSDTITQPAPLSANLVKLDCNANRPAYIKINTSGGTPPYTHTLNNIACTNDSIGNLLPEEYAVIITDAHLCTQTFTENIYLNFQSLETVNIFTPNGDDINEVFFPFSYENSSLNALISSLDTYELYVYDRWGRQVFNTTQASDTWNGKEPNGSVCSDGVYFWMVTINSKCENSGKQTFKGFVHLLK